MPEWPVLGKKKLPLSTPRTLVLFFWRPFSEMQDEVPADSNTVNVGIKANDKGIAFPKQPRAPTSSAHTALPGTSLPADRAQKKVCSVAAVCVHTTLMPFGFLV